MKQLMGENDAIFGGELSGHFYFRDNYNADSGVIAMGVVLSTLAASGKTMSKLVAPAKRYAQSGEINFVNEEPDKALEAIQEAYIETADIDELDGITLDCFEAEGWWCNVRKSNTEPLLRRNLEARDPATLHRMLDQIAPMLGTRSAH